MSDIESNLISSLEGGLPSSVRWSHLLLKGRLRPGDLAVDATAGNGHDALFLASAILPGGHLYAFDVQAAALSSTEKRLLGAGIQRSGFDLLNCGHEALAEVLPANARGSIRAIMFNLGYLPGSDKTLVTESSTTIHAIRAGLEFLAPHGLMTVVVYPGHAGGARESVAVSELGVELSPREFEVQHIRPVNRAAAPPELWAFWKGSKPDGKCSPPAAR